MFAFHETNIFSKAPVSRCEVLEKLRTADVHLMQNGNDASKGIGV